MSITDQIIASGYDKRQHSALTLPTWVLARIEELLPRSIEASAETGCGKSTILFSNLSKHHTVFTYDDSHLEESSIGYFRDCPATKLDRIEEILGFTQITVPQWKSHLELDVVLLDGPHAFPFPEIEYFYFYPRLKRGGILIIDDVHIATVGRMADIIAEDEMFELVELVGTTAVFRRTDAPTFNPHGDGWSLQNFNRHHSTSNHHPDDSGTGTKAEKNHVPFAQRFDQLGSMRIHRQYVFNIIRRRFKKFFRRS